MDLPKQRTCLAEMRAGLLILQNGRLNADSRRGLLQIVKDVGEDQVRLVWSERPPLSDGTAFQLDCPILSSEASFKQIPGKRAYVFKNPPTPGSPAPIKGVHDLFFWSQESDSAADARRAETFTALLRDQAAGSAVSEAGLQEPARTADSGQQPPSEVASGESKPADSQRPQHSVPAPAPRTTPAGGAAAAPPVSSALAAEGRRERSSGAIQASDLATILSNIGVPAPAAPDPRLLAALLAGAAGGQQSAAPEGPSINEVLRSELLLPLLREADVLPRLAPHLPEEHRTQEALEALVVSAQFRSQLDTFGGALQSGQLDLGQFGLQAEGYSVVAFLESIQRQVERERREGGAGA
ncbi:hypothetical protein WJX81_007548 [Elliptochloris bilobata]|uniref:Regulatory particle non-ATPase 13 n=1 Tax=Elliptochloris bilobata TaxID=381761 RepID=A0AAW1QV97_9CHLO